MLRRAVFLDRDGVINRAVVVNGKAYPPATLAEFELLPGVADTMRALRKAGLLVIVVTNQPDVRTGVQQAQVVEQMHEKLRSFDLCDDIKVCYHIDEDACSCRKPRPGMLLSAAREWGIDLTRSFLVGDRWRDIAAAKAAGCYSFFVECGYDEGRPESPDETVTSLAEAGSRILRIENSGDLHHE